MINLSKLKDVMSSISDMTNGRYSIAGEFKGYDKPLSIRCNIHKQVFDIKHAQYLLEVCKNPNKIFYGCKECRKEKDGTIELNCEICGKKIIRPRGWANGNKSKFAFCCREHKNIAQRLESGFGDMIPSHYGTRKDYRYIAFRIYPHKCAVCGWEEDERILEVHHKDMNRENNSDDNLIILCPNCHSKISRGLYMLQGNLLVDPDANYLKFFSLHTQRTKSPSMSCKVICVEDGLVFKSITECAKHYRVSDTTINYATVSDNKLCKSLDKHFERI